MGISLFNIFFCDTFYKMKDTDFGSYADDKTPYTKGDILDDVTKTLESDSVRLF